MTRPAYPSRESMRSRHSADEVSTLDEYAPTTLEVPSGAIADYLSSMRAPAAPPVAEAPPAAHASRVAAHSTLSWASWFVTVGVGLGLAFGAVLASCMR